MLLKVHFYYYFVDFYIILCNLIHLCFYFGFNRSVNQRPFRILHNVASYTSSFIFHDKQYGMGFFVWWNSPLKLDFHGSCRTLLSRTLYRMNLTSYLGIRTTIKAEWNYLQAVQITFICRHLLLILTFSCR